MIFFFCILPVEDFFFFIYNNESEAAKYNAITFHVRVSAEIRGGKDRVRNSFNISALFIFLVVVWLQRIKTHFDNQRQFYVINKKNRNSYHTHTLPHKHTHISFIYKSAHPCVY